MGKKYIAMSDLHLGQNGADRLGQYSLLSRGQLASNDPSHASNRLAKKVSDFAGSDRVTLVAVGDLFDLSLAYLTDALRDLVQLLKKLPSVERLLWVVGNHDHHIWMMHSEEQASLSALRAGNLPADGSLFRATPRDTTWPAALVNPLLAKLQIDCRVELGYPEHLFCLGDEQFYFTHGHLFGGLYTFLTDIVRPRLIGLKDRHAEAAATINLSLIEFIYWLLGETGHGFGLDGLAEEILIDTQRGDQARVKPLIDAAVETLLPDGVVTGIPDKWERSIVASLLQSLLKKAVSSEASASASSERYKSITATRRSLEQWLAAIGIDLHKRTHVVTGHTHMADRYDITTTRVTAYNMGSWLVEPTYADPDTYLMTIEEAGGSAQVEWGKV